ncbi:hypothetical protein HBH70_180430 [Parastagonospora nodorum]|nr:hypothetical protein HBH74_033430 [Parastagonospora nodorum]KAH4982716.1 hypothetical protein HBH73_029730 [Parastagonospora nodorum]KAH5099889.1 hypothetical protein HBI73_123900 [Parastagonospora nodorum]KAH5131013.1 hypothetical protein HBH70_180430 [Parastagonospora nodorum]KAH5376254.1 hypothetical protein HBI48_008650 [Parastagonospora nodorum]
MRATFCATRRSCFTSISKAGDITVLRPFCTHASILRDAGVQRNPFFSLFARLVRARGVSCQILKIPLNIPSHHRLFARFRARTQRVIRDTSRRHSLWSFSCTVHTPIHVRSPSSNLDPRQVHIPLPVRLYIGIPVGLSRAGGNEEMGGYSMKCMWKRVLCNGAQHGGCVHLSLGSLWMRCLGVSIGIKSEALEMVVGGDVWGRGIGGCWVDARPRLMMCTLGCVFVASASC